MKINKMLAMGIVLAAILLLLQAPAALAQDQDPSARVARLNYSNGSVSFQPGGEGDWVQAVTNRPLTTGDNLWAERGSRAELHIGSTALRMDSQNLLTFLDLDDHTTQLRLSEGVLIVQLRHLDDGDLFEVDTPNLAFALQRTGEYRIDVNADGNETIATVWKGRGEVTGGGNSYIVVAGQAGPLHGDRSIGSWNCTDPGSGRLRKLGIRSRPSRGTGRVSQLHLARGYGVRGPRRVRPLALRRRLRSGLDAGWSRGRMGSLPLRALGLDRALGMDVGGR